MRIVIFGLTVSSSWGNGHATLWRGLLRALAPKHEIVFFERDLPFYAEHRDLWELPGHRLVLYRSWEEVREQAVLELTEADAGMITSYCPDAAAAADLVLSSRIPIRAYYDLDTPVTLARLEAGEEVPWIPPVGLSEFDVVLSYTGGEALRSLSARLGARRVVPLYGSFDPEVHKPEPGRDEFRCDLSYLGTYAEDRQTVLDRMFLEPAREMRERRFLIGGAQYPHDFPWLPNVWFARHVAPGDHPAFYGSSRVTLNVTRATMARMGRCPSGRLFEAAGCGVAILSDWWEGLEEFFEPGAEILIGGSPRETRNALELSDEELRRIASRARERALAEHTSSRRAAELVAALESAAELARIA